MTTRVIQLNIRGMGKSKVVELKNLLVRSKPDIVLIQETLLNEQKTSPNFKGYSMARWDRKTGPGGGLMTLVKDNIPFKIVDDFTPGKNEIGIISVKEDGTDNWISVINYYNRTATDFDFKQFKDAFQKCKERKIIAGDFNLHNPMWDSTSSPNNNSNLLADFITDPQNMVCLITPIDLGTRLNPLNGKTSTIDLTIASLDLSVDFEVVIPSPFDSDHFPVMSVLNFSAYRLQLMKSVSWKFRKESWPEWQREVDSDLTDVELPTSVEELNEKLTQVMVNASERVFGYVKLKRKSRNSTPGWNAACQKAYKERNTARNKFRRNPTVTNKIEMNAKQAIFRKIVPQEIKNGWKTLIETKFTKTTSIKELWRSWKVYTGQRSSPISGIMIHNGTTAATTPEKIKLLKEYLIANIPPQLSTQNRPTMQPTQVFPKNDIELVEQDIDTIIKKLKPGAMGPDRIHNEMLSNMSPLLKASVLTLFNRSIKEGYVPSLWKKAAIIPILKPQKDPTSPKSYRPIALTSCLCKLMERLIKKKVLPEIEKVVQPEQLGFLPQRSTIDCLVRLENQIKQGFRLGKETLAVFLDMTSAFDRVNIPTLMAKLKKLNISPQIVEWIGNFLTERKIEITLENHSSGFFSAPNNVGLPQGGVLSPLLFLVYCHDINLDTILGCKLYLYADDIAVAASSRDRGCLKASVQKALYYLENWTMENYMSFSTEKSVSVLFSRKNRTNAQPPIVSLAGVDIQHAEKFCYLGVLLDSKLLWTNHIDYLVGNLRSRANFVNAICLSKRGAPYSCVSKLIGATITSKLDYGSMFYREATKHNLQKLDSAFNQVLRRALGCLKTTPTPALYCELGVTSLQRRRNNLQARYFLKKMGSTNHIVYKECIATWNQDLQFRPRFSPTVYKYSCLMSNAGLPGLVPTPNIDDLSSRFNGIGNVINLALDNRINDSGTIILKLEWYRLTLQWTDFTHIYTDGSKSEMGVGCAFVVPSTGTSCGFKLPDKLTVFSAEMIAIYQALLYIKSNGIVGSFLICSDSLSVLNYLAMKRNDAKETAAQIEKIVDDLLIHGYDLQLTWVPAHAGIPGNESADKMAKWACRNGELLDVNLSLSEYIQGYEAKSAIDEKADFTRKSTNTILDLYDFKPPPLDLIHSERKIATTIFRIRSGHAKVNSVLFKWNLVDSPNCIVCNVYEDVRHVIMSCKKYYIQREILKRKVLKLFGAFTFRAVVGHSSAPPWARRVSVSALGCFIRTSSLFDVL